jgi:hypothetical protein
MTVISFVTLENSFLVAYSSKKDSGAFVNKNGDKEIVLKC